MFNKKEEVSKSQGIFSSKNANNFYGLQNPTTSNSSWRRNSNEFTDMNNSSFPVRSPDPFSQNNLQDRGMDSSIFRQAAQTPSTYNTAFTTADKSTAQSFNPFNKSSNPFNFQKTVSIDTFAPKQPPVDWFATQQPRGRPPVARASPPPANNRNTMDMDVGPIAMQHPNDGITPFTTTPSKDLHRPTPENAAPPLSIASSTSKPAGFQQGGYGGASVGFLKKYVPSGPVPAQGGGKMSFLCRVCGASFATNVQLVSHLKAEMHFDNGGAAADWGGSPQPHAAAPPSSFTANPSIGGTKKLMQLQQQQQAKRLTTANTNGLTGPVLATTPVKPSASVPLQSAQSANLTGLKADITPPPPPPKPQMLARASLVGDMRGAEKAVSGDVCPAVEDGIPDDAEGDEESIAVFQSPLVPATSVPTVAETPFRKTDVSDVVSSSNRRYALELPTAVRPLGNESISGLDDDDGDVDGVVTGLCTDMCPSQERKQRLEERDIHKFEKMFLSSECLQNFDINESVISMVKKCQRSAADHRLNIPQLVRTPKTLLRTIAYLEDTIMDAKLTYEDIDELELYLFIWDRFRMIAKDFILQNFRFGGRVDGYAVECHERMARWYISMEHRMRGTADFVLMHSHQNKEQLNKVLKSLNEFYDDIAECSGRGETVIGVDFTRICANEAEFRAYYALCQLYNPAEVQRYVSRLSEKVLTSDPIRTVLAVTTAMRLKNYAAFFRILRTCSYLEACCLQNYVCEMRIHALRVMSRSHRAGRNETQLPLEIITALLMFESEDDAFTFCTGCGMEVIPTDDQWFLVLSSSNLDDLLPINPKTGETVLPVVEPMWIGIEGRVADCPTSDITRGLTNNAVPFEDNNNTEDQPIVHIVTRPPVPLVPKPSPAPIHSNTSTHQISRRNQTKYLQQAPKPPPASLRGWLKQKQPVPPSQPFVSSLPQQVPRGSRKAYSHQDRA